MMKMMMKRRYRYFPGVLTMSLLVLGFVQPTYAERDATAQVIKSSSTQMETGAQAPAIKNPSVQVEANKKAPSTENASIQAEADVPPVTTKDPYQGFNRAMYRFNDFLDTYALKPVATLYSKIIPKPVAKGVGNFFANIDTVPTVINDVLQVNFYQATSDFWRLAINSTAGIVGFFDIATDIGLEPNKEDFGLTLARWGYQNSNYLVLPFFGPSTVRDGIGIPVDFYAFSIYPRVKPVETRNILFGLGVVSRRADLLRFENVMDQAALDKYTFMRDAYLQRRSYLIQRNKELGDPYLEKNKTEVVN